MPAQQSASTLASTADADGLGVPSVRDRSLAKHSILFWVRSGSLRLHWVKRRGHGMLTTPNPARVVFEEMNRNPGEFWPETTCALFVRVARALVEAGVIKGAEEEKKE